MTREATAPTDDHRRTTRSAQRFARRRPLVLIAVGVVLYATGPVMVRGSSVTGPVFSFWRLWTGVLVLGVALAIHQARTRDRFGAQAVKVSVLAGLAFGAHQVVFMTAIKLVGVTEVTLIATLSPIVTGVLAVPFFGERVSVRFRSWSVLAMGGSAVVVLAGSRGPDGDVVGTALAVLNVLLFALFFLLSKRSREHVAVVPFLFAVTAVAAVAVSTYGLATGQALLSPTRNDAILIVLVTLGPGTLGHFVMTWPLRWVPANVPPVMRLAIPFLAGAAAWLLYDEVVTWAHVAGGAVTMTGVAGALVTRPRVPMDPGEA